MIARPLTIVGIFACAIAIALSVVIGYSKQTKRGPVSLTIQYRLGN